MKLVLPFTGKFLTLSGCSTIKIMMVIFFFFLRVSNIAIIYQTCKSEISALWLLKQTLFQNLEEKFGTENGN